MAGISAMPIASVEGVQSTDDGLHALLKAKIAEGEMVLAFPEGQLRPLLDLVCVAIAETSKKLERHETAVFPVSWWEFGQTADGLLAVTFRLGNGASLSFQLAADQIPHMRQTLEVMEGRQLPDRPSKTRPN